MCRQGASAAGNALCSFRTAAVMINRCAAGAARA